MALSLSQTAYLSDILKPGMRVASFGYPDIIASHDVIEKWLNHDLVSLDYRKDSEAICKRHGLRNTLIPDAESLFKCLKCDLDVYDIVRERGCEHLCDLNFPLPMDKFPNLIYAGYDIVLDVGTAEHCFNIGQALINMADMAKEGGYIIHENPFNCGNHGFYNLNPTLFADFYGANGFELVDCKLVDRSGGAADVPITGRFRFVEAEVNTFALAKRVRMQEFVFPTQTKYKRLYAAAGLSGELKETANV